MPDESPKSTASGTGTDTEVEATECEDIVSTDVEEVADEIPGEAEEAAEEIPAEAEEKRRAVQKVLCQNVFKFRDRRQVHDLIDAHELTVVQHQLFDLLIRQIDPCLVKRLIEQLLLCHDNSPQILLL